MKIEVPNWKYSDKLTIIQLHAISNMDTHSVTYIFVSCSGKKYKIILIHSHNMLYYNKVAVVSRYSYVLHVKML